MPNSCRATVLSIARYGALWRGLSDRTGGLPPLPKVERMADESVTCRLCGRQTAADLARCTHCGGLWERPEEIASRPVQSVRGSDSTGEAHQGEGYGGLWHRAAAFFIDWVIVRVLTALFYTLPLAPVGATLAFVIAMAYFTLGFGPPLGGRTVGAKLMGLRLADTRGGIPSYLRAALRGSGMGALLVAPGVVSVAAPALAEVSALLVWAIALLTWLAAAFDERKRSLIDVIAGTVCLRTRPVRTSRKM